MESNNSSLSGILKTIGIIYAVLGSIGSIIWWANTSSFLFFVICACSTFIVTVVFLSLSDILVRLEKISNRQEEIYKNMQNNTRFNPFEETLKTDENVKKEEHKTNENVKQQRDKDVAMTITPKIVGDKIECPFCGLLQRKDRNVCFSCGLKFKK